MKVRRDELDHSMLYACIEITTKKPFVQLYTLIKINIPKLMQNTY
jgi:hypothetical protein